MSKVVCSGCSKEVESTLKCPTCSKKGLPDAYFCGQECFKANWKTHKTVHKAFEVPEGIDPKFVNYSYTGSLRKGVVSGRRAVPDNIERPPYVSHPEGVDPREAASKEGSAGIHVHNEEEIKIMREACRIGRQILDLAHAAIKVGATTDDIDKVVHEAAMERGVYPSPLGYAKFPKSCCTSINEVICHGIPDSTKLQNGDIVNVDVSIYYKGHHSDLNETYFVGEVDEAGQRLVKTTYECLHKAIAMCKPGTFYRDLGDVISKHARANKFSVVRSYCGHGVGALFHTSPTVPHYSKNKAVGVMRPGHIFTIEPMINEGSWHDKTWPDNWTSVTKDGHRSAQFEETLLITEDGVEILTKGRYVPGQPWQLKKKKKKNKKKKKKAAANEQAKK